MSRLRAKCPDCGTLTAVAIGPEYECHVCGRTFAAGLVRVPRAWGSGGEEMAAAAHLPLPYPETAVVAEETQRFVQAQSVNLIETLADRLAAHLLKNFPIQKITVEIRKFPLEHAKYVSAVVTRHAAAG